MDIFEVLASSGPGERGSARCKLAAWLDAIPADEPGRDQLVTIVETKRGEPGAMSGRRVITILNRLGFPYTAENAIHDHRNHVCACFRG